MTQVWHNFWTSPQFITRRHQWWARRTFSRSLKHQTLLITDNTEFPALQFLWQKLINSLFLLAIRESSNDFSHSSTATWVFKTTVTSSPLLSPMTHAAPVCAQVRVCVNSLAIVLRIPVFLIFLLFVVRDFCQVNFFVVLTHWNRIVLPYQRKIN